MRQGLEELTNEASSVASGSGFYVYEITTTGMVGDDGRVSRLKPNPGLTSATQILCKFQIRIELMRDIWKEVFRFHVEIGRFVGESGKILKVVIVD